LHLYPSCPHFRRCLERYLYLWKRLDPKDLLILASSEFRNRECSLQNLGKPLYYQLSLTAEG
jgi:hypothetical protein